MKKIETKIKKAVGSNYCCSTRNCGNEGFFFLKLSVASLGGWFCKDCAADLKQRGLLEEVIH
jgi:hypothetical protein